MNAEPTYIFKHGNVYTMVDNEVVAAVKEADFDEQGVGGLGGNENFSGEPMQMPPPPPDVMGDQMIGDVCQQCGDSIDPASQTCLGCGAPGPQQGGGEFGSGPGEEYGSFTDDDGGRRQPLNHPQLGLAHPHGASITTPGGLKGTIMGKVAGIWGDEVTVRLETGRIVRLPVSDQLKTAAAEPKEESNPILELEMRLADVDADLQRRLGELKDIEKTARSTITQLDLHDDETRRRLHTAIVQAMSEAEQISDAMAHQVSVEAYEAPAPFRMEAVEQESFGGHTSSWLDHTMREITAEAEATDYDKLLSEGPEALVAEIDGAVLADQGAVKSIASRFVRSHTATGSEEVRERYEQAFIERVEDRRRRELATRKQTARKEAATQQDEYSNLPDDVLFGL